MHQAAVAAVTRQERATIVRATLMGVAPEASRYFVLEIVTEDGEFLSVPNEAIIETGGRRVVYVREGDGGYAPKEIQVGVQGELYTQVLGGVNVGERVVTIGSFFIDAEHKLKGS
jgi:Cu(I)/Ag(I) efflux system membrane fusion protein